MNEELKACPFCGNVEVKIKDNDKKFAICYVCLTENFVEDWNTRPIEDALQSEIARLTQRVRELEDANRWIPVSERLPEKDSNELWDTYLCKLNFYGDIRTAPLWFNQGGWYTHYASGASNYSSMVIAWRNMPLPPMPAEGE